MGLMDKMKAQASQMAERAQEAGKVGQAKIEALQAKRKADSLLEELGLISYLARAARGAPGDDARVTDLVEQLRQYEAGFGPFGADVGSSASPAGGAADASDDAPADGPAAGDGATSGGTGSGSSIPTASYGEGEV